MVRAIVGGCWGDEGKGKITDMLASQADIVVRFQGGANAGHTIINEYGKFALHLLPSGVFREGVANVLGSGVAFDPENFAELKRSPSACAEAEYSCILAGAASAFLPGCRINSGGAAGQAGFGSTQSGIAPFIPDKYARKTFRFRAVFARATSKVAAGRERIYFQGFLW